MVNNMTSRACTGSFRAPAWCGSRDSARGARPEARSRLYSFALLPSSLLHPLSFSLTPYASRIMLFLSSFGTRHSVFDMRK
jgi:hypothetical protein